MQDKQATYQPTFLCIGPQKTGTGWLHTCLKRHNNYYSKSLPVKELDYFYIKFIKEHDSFEYFKYRFANLKRGLSTLIRFTKKKLLGRKIGNKAGVEKRITHLLKVGFGNFSLIRFESFFSTPINTIAGDISPAYFSIDDPKHIEFIANRYPNIKIIIFMREPVSRLWSAVKMKLADKGIQPTRSNIEYHIQKELEFSKLYPVEGYHLWKKYFKSEQIFISYYEDLLYRPYELFQKICDFLNIPSDLNTQNYNFPKQMVKTSETFESAKAFIEYRHKKSKSSARLPDDIRLRLETYYLPQIKQLNDELGGAVIQEWINQYSKLNSENSVS